VFLAGTRALTDRIMSGAKPLHAAVLLGWDKYVTADGMFADLKHGLHDDLLGREAPNRDSGIGIVPSGSLLMKLSLERK